MLRPGWLVLATNMLGVASAVDTPPDEAARLSRSVSDLRVKGKLSDAEKAATELIAIRKNQHGPVHEEVLDAVLVRAVILADLERMKECRAARHELVELHEKLRGKSHWSTVTARHELADADAILALTPEQFKTRGELFRHYTASFAATRSGRFRDAAAESRMALDLYAKVYSKPTVGLGHLKH